MTAYTLKVDNVEYPHIGIAGVTREAALMEQNSGWTLGGKYRRGIVGTYYNYSITIYRMQGNYAEEYDALYEALTAPVESHTILLPYGESQLELECYIETATDEAWEQNGTMIWGALKINCLAAVANRTAV